MPQAQSVQRLVLLVARPRCFSFSRWARTVSCAAGISAGQSIIDGFGDRRHGVVAVVQRREHLPLAARRWSMVARQHCVGIGDRRAVGRQQPARLQARTRSSDRRYCARSPPRLQRIITSHPHDQIAGEQRAARLVPEHR